MLARWTLTAGQVHDLTEAQGLIDGLSTEAVVADKAYDSDALITAIEALPANAVIPPKANRIEQRAFDRHQYKHRNLIECFLPVSSSSDASPHATTNSPADILPSSLSSPASCGFANCQQTLVKTGDPPAVPGRQ